MESTTPFRLLEAGALRLPFLVAAVTPSPLVPVLVVLGWVGLVWREGRTAIPTAVLLTVLTVLTNLVLVAGVRSVAVA